MKKKRIVVLTSLLTLLVASFALVPPASSLDPSENHRYITMKGEAKACSDLTGQPPTLDWKTPFQTRPPDFMPFFAEQNITFSDPWQLPGYGWIVNLTVPHETYVGLEHAWYDQPSKTWYKLVVTLEQDGYGWIFLNATGDVDCYTFNNDTGVWWTSPSPKAGQKAADTGALPSPGPDGVAGTADDGFGDGTNDTRGSSILLLPTTMRVEYGLGSTWNLLFESSWPQVLTTGTAYDIVIETASELDGWNSTETGQPWEFYAGLDHPEYDPVPHGHPKWNAYVTYVCAWSVLNYTTALGELDVIFQVVEKKVREDYVIADINCDELVDIGDIVLCAIAFGAKDEGPGPDGKPNTGDDKPIADPNYNAAGDLMPDRGLVDIGDIVRIAIDFGKTLTP